MSIFNKVKLHKLKRNTFDLSHEVKLTTDAGRLTPIFCRSVLPGDKFSINTEMFCRVAPMVAPIMHLVNIYVHYFFVPNRIIWSDWEDFITGGVDGTISPTYPRIKMSLASGSVADGISAFRNNSLMDYLGFPTINDGSNVENTLEVDALPFRAYNLIYNDFYRDQNFQEEVEIGRDLSSIIDIEDGYEDYAELLKIKNRCWPKDYFTSALPWTQRGDATTIGLNGDAEVISNGDPFALQRERPSAAPLEPTSAALEPQSGSRLVYNVTSDDDSENLFFNNGLIADLSTASATTINELRTAFAIQRFKEIMARVGSRYVEQLRGLFGVTSSDARLQRPEFLGGGKVPIKFGEVLQTSATESNSPQGNPAGRGVSAGTTGVFKKFFEEHGQLIGIMSIMPRAGYFNGLPREFAKFDKFDYYFPQFAHIGEQAIKKSEIFYDFAAVNQNAGTFGYTPRYAEYKCAYDTVHGDFRGNMNFWHMTREFSSLPGLNSDFLQVQPDDVDRVFSVEYDPEDDSVQRFWIQLYHHVKARRAMPKFGTPLI